MRRTPELLQALQEPIPRRKALNDAAKALKIKILIDAGFIPKPPVPQKKNRPKPTERMVCGHSRRGKRGPNYPPTLKATVMAAMLSGEAVGETARMHGLDKRLVSQWRRKIWRIAGPRCSFQGVKLSGIDLSKLRPTWNFQKRKKPASDPPGS
jgi:hypothetical protein